MGSRTAGTRKVVGEWFREGDYGLVFGHRGLGKSWMGFGLDGSDYNERIIRSLRVTCSVASSVRGWRDGLERYSRAYRSSARRLP